MAFSPLSFRSTYSKRFCRRACVFALFGAMAQGLLVPQVFAQSASAVDASNASPAGFTSAVNTPTAQVLKEGTQGMIGKLRFAPAGTERFDE